MSKKILIVDDEEDERKLVKLMLRGYDCEIGETADGAQALELALAMQPDLIFMDYLLPNKNGYEIIQDMRRNDILRKTPIIMLTVRRFDDGFKDWIKLEVKDFIQKPIVSEALLASIAKAIGPLPKKAPSGEVTS